MVPNIKGQKNNHSRELIFYIRQDTKLKKYTAYQYIFTLNIFGNKLLLLFWAHDSILGHFLSDTRKLDTRNLGMLKENGAVEIE